METLLIEDKGEELIIRINKSDFNEQFIDDMVKRIRFEKLVQKAQFDPSIISAIKDELSKDFVEKDFDRQSQKK